ncbi:MAG: hypothetical protein EHM13_08340 [Acidobacteria bacterium]|nr:MAG: hypothetical protein EHM13_08340 [Acidobacteriota bacterium]
MLASAWGLDPQRIVKPPAPPPPPPPEDKPKLSIALKGDDLNPFAPQYANVLTLLKLYDVDEGLQPPGPPQAGAGGPMGEQSRNLPNGSPRPGQRPVRAVRGIPPVDQHDADLSGKMPGPRPQSM